MKHYTLNGKTVAELREQRGLTQGALAERVGVANSYICLLESGARQPSPAVAARIARALGASWGDVTALRPAEAAS